MARKGKSTEKIIAAPREAEVRIAQGETAGKICRGFGISEQQHLRTLLVHGARAVLRTAVKKTDPRSNWGNELRERRGHNRATVAVVNKNARVIWAVLRSGEPYRAAA